MTTSEPSLAREIAAAAARRGASHALDAPVSGGDVGARERARSRSWSAATGRRSTRVTPLLRAHGQDRSSTRAAAGAGQHTKMVNQILIASDMIGVCEALLYGYKAGLDLERVLQSVGGGAAG